MRSILSVVLFSLLYITGGCTDLNNDIGIPCTDELRSHSIVVLDSSGEPVTDADVTSKNLRTGDTLDTSDPDMSGTEYYVIVNSLHIPDEVTDGDEIEVQGIKGDASFTETYIVSADHCHPTDVEGPDEVTLSE